MKKRISKIMTVVLCLVMLSTITLSAFATNSTLVHDAGHIEQSVGADILEQNLPQIYLEGKVDFVAGEIEKSVVERDVAVFAENRPPVADLRATVLNPDSMINGKFTTETQIAWLWSFDGQNFTYDPDGDPIVDIRIGGIGSDDIIGTITGDLGFATQFKTAAQYVLTFQVQDSNGAWSNVAQYAFSIEPADGNTRPICKIGYSADTLVPNQIMLISWANSSDIDAGDKITSVEGRIIKDGVTTSLLDYIVQNDNTGCYVSFPETGTYQIWIRVSDSHNAWSDWVIFTVGVESAVISNVSINGIYESQSKEAYWVDNFAAMRVDEGQIRYEGVKVLCEDFGSHYFPTALPSKLVFGNSFTVSGRLLTKSGAPVANTRVNIWMPLTHGRQLNKTVLTDAYGNFSYSPTAKEFWVDTGYYRPGEEINFLICGDLTREETQYIRFSTSTGTNFLYPTYINVSAAGQTYSENVTCEVGYSKNPMIGNSLYFNGQWGGI